MRVAPVGVDVPLPVVAEAGPGRRAARQPHEHLRGDGARVLRRACGSGGRPGRKDRDGHGRAEDLVRSPAQPAPAPGRSRWRLARAGRRAVLARARAAADERGRRRAREHRQARRVQRARGHSCGGARPGGARGAAALRAAPADRPGAPRAASRRPGAHHPEEGVHRRDGRGGHGPAVAAVPPGHQRASAALAHRALRGRARGGQPVEAPHRAEAAHGGAGRSAGRCSKTSRTAAATATGQTRRPSGGGGGTRAPGCSRLPVDVPRGSASSASCSARRPCPAGRCRWPNCWTSKSSGPSCRIAYVPRTVSAQSTTRSTTRTASA